MVNDWSRLLRPRAVELVSVCARVFYCHFCRRRWKYLFIKLPLGFLCCLFKACESRVQVVFGGKKNRCPKMCLSEWQAKQRRSGLHLDRVVEEKIKEGLGEKLEKDTLGFPLPLIVQQHQTTLPSLWLGVRFRDSSLLPVHPTWGLTAARDQARVWGWYPGCMPLVEHETRRTSWGRFYVWLRNPTRPLTAVYVSVINRRTVLNGPLCNWNWCWSSVIEIKQLLMQKTKQPLFTVYWAAGQGLSVRDTGLRKAPRPEGWREHT